MRQIYSLKWEKTLICCFLGSICLIQQEQDKSVGIFSFLLSFFSTPGSTVSDCGVVLNCACMCLSMAAVISAHVMIVHRTGQETRPQMY